MTTYSDDESSSDSEVGTLNKKRYGEGSQGRENTELQRIAPLRPDVDTLQIHAEEEAKRVTGSNGEKENASVSKRPFVLLAIFVVAFFIATIFLSKKSRKPVSDEMKLSGKDVVTVPSLPDPVHDSVKALNKPLHHYDPLFQLL